MKSESHYTPHVPYAGSYNCWNGKTPEKEWIDFLAAYARVKRPGVVVETGAGKGMTTVRVLKKCPRQCHYFAIEADERWRLQINTNDARLSVYDALPQKVTVLDAADMVILDSSLQLRLAELALWVESGKPGSVCFVHDASSRHPEDSVHRKIYDACHAVNMAKVWLANPRGGCLLVH